MNEHLFRQVGLTNFINSSSFSVGMVSRAVASPGIAL